MKSPLIFICLFLISGIFLVQCRVINSIDLNSVIVVPTPADNLQTDEKIALGRSLFFDKRLSLDGTISCATCHDPSKVFSDQLPKSIGIYGQETERNAPSILNSGFLKTAMFDAHLATLEMQVIVPLQEKTEMGHNMKELIPQLRKIKEYQDAAKKIFNRDFDAYVLTRSISAFERSLLSMNSRFDQYQNGNKNSLSKDELAGWKLFSEKLYCIACHKQPYFTTFVAENNGLYASYNGKEDQGRFRIHNDSSDIGKFKVPSLRNIELSSPYMHDGSISSLEEVIEHYSKGGNKHPLQNKSIVEFRISESEKKQLVSFLKSLTDTSYIQRMNF
jgi:cytochrome c peroxidase